MYPVDRKKSDVQLYHTYATIGAGAEHRTEQTKELATKDAYRIVARMIGETYSWVRAFSEVRWQERSDLFTTKDLHGGRLYVGSLYLDRGGLDG